MKIPQVEYNREEIEKIKIRVDALERINNHLLEIIKLQVAKDKEFTKFLNDFKL